MSRLALSLLFLLSLLFGATSAVCGDGIVEAGEQCDDANAIETDGCLSNCTLEITSCVPRTLSFFDAFNVSSYSNSDGNADWTGGPWIEGPSMNGPTVGSVSVVTGTSSLSFIEMIAPPVSGATAERLVPFTSVFGFTSSEYDAVRVVFDIRAADAIAYFLTVCDGSCTTIYHRQCFFDASSSVTCPAAVGTELSPTDSSVGLVAVPVFATPLGDLTVRIEVAPEMPALSHVLGVTLLEVDSVRVEYTASTPFCDACGVYLEETTASPIIVTTVSDVIDPLDGMISVREAVSIAKGRGGDQEIVTPAGTYVISLFGDDDDNCTGDFDLR